MSSGTSQCGHPADPTGGVWPPCRSHWRRVARPPGVRLCAARSPPGDRGDISPRWCRHWAGPPQRSSCIAARSHAPPRTRPGRPPGPRPRWGSRTAGSEAGWCRPAQRPGPGRSGRVRGRCRRRWAARPGPPTTGWSRGSRRRAAWAWSSRSPGRWAGGGTRNRCWSPSPAGTCGRFRRWPRLPVPPRGWAGNSPAWGRVACGGGGSLRSREPRWEVGR